MLHAQRFVLYLVFIICGVVCGLGSQIADNRVDTIMFFSVFTKIVPILN